MRFAGLNPKGQMGKSSPKEAVSFVDVVEGGPWRVGVCVCVCVCVLRGRVGGRVSLGSHLHSHWHAHSLTLHLTLTQMLTTPIPYHRSVDPEG